ncbi:MAG: RICIN domain-containing protein [Pseudonocardiaceae bacterium]
MKTFLLGGVCRCLLSYRKVQYKIVSELTQKVLSVNGDTANDGTTVIQWDDLDQQNQRW